MQQMAYQLMIRDDMWMKATVLFWTHVAWLLCHTIFTSNQVIKQSDQALFQREMKYSLGVFRFLKGLTLNCLNFCRRENFEFWVSLSGFLRAEPTRAEKRKTNEQNNLNRWCWSTYEEMEMMLSTKFDSNLHHYFREGGKANASAG